MKLSEEELYAMPIDDLRALAAAKTVRKLFWRALLIKLRVLPKRLDFVSPMIRKIDIEFTAYVNSIVDARVEFHTRVADGTTKLIEE